MAECILWDDMTSFDLSNLTETYVVGDLQFNICNDNKPFATLDNIELTRAQSTPSSIDKIRAIQVFNYTGISYTYHSDTACQPSKNYTLTTSIMCDSFSQD